MLTENLVILFDLNSMYWMKYHQLYKQKLEEARATKKPSPVLNFEELVECFSFILTSQIAKNNQNKVIIYAFDEKDTVKVFPTDEFDEAYTKMLNFVEVRKKIARTISDLVCSKELHFYPHSQVIKALSKAICSRVLA